VNIRNSHSTDMVRDPTDPYGGIRILQNSAWMIGEQVVRLGLSLVVTVWLARQLGTADYGVLSYAVAYASVFAVAANLGLNRGIVREVLAVRDRREQAIGIMSSVFFARLMAAPLIAVAAILVAALFNLAEIGAIAVVLTTLILSSFDNVEQFFQAEGDSKRVVKARSACFFVSVAVKLLALSVGAPVWTFLILVVVDQLLVMVAMSFVYLRFGWSSHAISFAQRIRQLWSAFDVTLASRLIRESWPEMISGFGIMAIMRTDQVMLNYFFGPSSVGVYSVAVRISEVWYFVPAAIVAATFPRILNERSSNLAQYHRRLSQLMVCLCFISYIAGLTATLASQDLVERAFGTEYVDSATFLTAHIWGGLFLCLGLASGSWIHAEKLIVISAKRVVLGMLCNIALNLVLIPTHGGLGAAISTVIAYIVSYFIYDLFDPKMRPIFWMKVRALLLHWT